MYKYTWFVCVLGNPGVGDYYNDFMWTLSAESNHNVSIWCVSHAGHVTVPDSAPASSKYSYAAS